MATAPNYGAILGGGNPASLAQISMSAYQGAFAENQNRYADILGGYDQLQTEQRGTSNAIAGYYQNTLYGVQNALQGYDASERGLINDRSAQEQGAATQQLTNRGLGNSTITQSVAGGIEADRNKAHLALTGQTQRLNADYMSQLGTAANQYQERSLAQSLGLGGDRLNFQERVQSAYPEAGLYAQLAQIYAAGQAGLNPGNFIGGGGGVPPAPPPGITTLGTRGSPSKGPTPGYGQAGAPPQPSYSNPSAGGGFSGGLPGGGGAGLSSVGGYFAGGGGGGGGYDTIGSYTGLPNAFGGGFASGGGTGLSSVGGYFGGNTIGDYTGLPSAFGGGFDAGGGFTDQYGFDWGDIY